MSNLLLHAHFRSFGKSNQLVEAELQKLDRKCQAILEEPTPALKAIAEELRRKRVLTGQQLTELAASA